MGRRPRGDGSTLDDAIMLCRNAIKAEELRMVLSIVLPGRAKINLLEGIYLDYLQISGSRSPKSTLHRLLKRNGWRKMKSESGARVWKMRKEK